MDFKPKNDVLTVICHDCGKKKPADGATEHSQALCHCPATKSNVINLRAVDSQVNLQSPQLEPESISSQSELPQTKSGSPQAPMAVDSASRNPFLFGSDYEVLEELGTGSLTKAYKARRKNSATPLVIKVLRSEFGDNPRTVKRFRLEAERACNLNHPNVAAVYDVGTTSGGLPFIVTDYLEGINIDEYLKKEGFFSEHEAIEVFIQVCDGLRDAHKKGLIHRDLKPKNIILKKTGKDTYLTKVADFGIAKVLPNPGRETKYFTPDGDSFGDAQYMSPEQCMGKRLDARSDIYALGCLMYQCLSGKPPFTSGNPMRLALKQLNEAPALLSERFVDLDISPGIEHVIMRALEKDPEDRYQTVAEMSKDLALVKAGKTPRPVPRREVPIPPAAPQVVRKEAPDHHDQPRPLPKSPSAPVANLRFGPELVAFLKRHGMFSGVLAVIITVCVFFLLWSLFAPQPTYHPPFMSSMYTPDRSDVDAEIPYRSPEESFLRQDPEVRTSIKSITGDELYFAHTDTVKGALEEAVANGINLVGADFTGAQLAGVNLHNAKLSGAQFSKANLSNADCTNANLSGAQFSQANLANANFGNALLIGSIFTQCNLRNIELGNSEVTNSIWNGNKRALHFAAGPYLVAQRSIYPDVKSDDRNQTKLRLIKLHTNDQKVLFSCTARSVADALSMAQTKHIDLSNIDLRATDLVGAHLEKAKLQYADLEGADLTNCDLDGADLTGAFMQGVTISHSSFDSANLFLTGLQGAYLNHVNFDGAKFTRTNCTGVTVVNSTGKNAQFGRLNFSEAEGENALFNFGNAQQSDNFPAKPFDSDRNAWIRLDQYRPR